METEYTDKTAVAGQTYIYTVVAFDGVKTSTPSPYGAVTVTDKQKPVIELDRPQNFVAQPGEVNVKLSWDVVNGASTYELYNGASLIYTGPLTTFTDTGVREGTTYDYYVQAVDGTNKGKPSNLTTTTLIKELAYPANFKITVLEYNRVRLEWDQVNGATDYQVTRDGNVVKVATETWIEEDASSLVPGETYVYKVAGIKNGLPGKEAIKQVTVPQAPVQGQAPSGDLIVKANRVYHDRVGLSWTTVTGATYYDVYQDETLKVWSGSLNAVTDNNVGPEEKHTYKVVAGNEWGTLESNVIDVTTPAAPQSIVITPSQPMEGTVTFDFKVVDGSYHYVERNPQTKYEPLPDGTFHKTYYNSATGETRDEGIVTPVNGKLNFSESGVDPSKDYHYDIVAVVKKADGSEEVVAREEVTVTTPADGGGVTVPGTIVNPGTGGGTTPDPGNGGGTTPDPGTGGGTTPGGDTGTTTPPSTGGGNAGGSTGGGSGGGSTGGSGSAGGSTGGGATTPAGEDQSSVPGTVTDPTEGEGSEGSTGDHGSEVDNDTNYSDISGNFAEEAIKNLTASGILKGYADGTFGPNKKITRAEFAIMTKRALDYENTGSYVQGFKDFNENAWYAEELLTALDAGVTKGFTDGTYRPNVFIPREQAAVMIANILEKNNFQANLSEKIFKDDKDIVAWAESSVYLLKSHKIVEGQNNFFYPKREITRAEAAVMIDRLLSVLKK